MVRTLGLALLVSLGCAGCARETAPPPDVLAEVRETVTKKDFGAGRRAVDQYRTAHGVTPALIDAMSVLAFGAMGAKDWDTADAVARSAYELAHKALDGKPLDAEAQTATALGRSIEVIAQVSAQRGARTDAVAFLEREIGRHRNTSIEKRIQKNINLLSLEGTEAPPLDLSESLGTPPPALASLKGRVVLMFFWAHWCADCKAQGPILAKLAEKYEGKGLTIVAPTQRFGYVAGGEKATAEVENPYIDSVRKTYYPVLTGRPIPLSEANHRRYGVSSTPTLVVVDRRGIIRLYRPGRMTEEELDVLLRRLVDERA